jgi:hypothetical protein
MGIKTRMKDKMMSSLKENNTTENVTVNMNLSVENMTMALS